MSESRTLPDDRPDPRARAVRILMRVVLFSAGLAAATPASPAAPPPPPAVPSASPAPTPAAPAVPAAVPKRNIAGPGDYGLRERLVEQLGKDPDLAQERFTLFLVNGGAVFTGPVRSCALKMRALRLAAVTAGVINVTDEMEVPRGQVGDAALRDAIETQLTDQHAALAIKGLRVSVEDGVATINGTVDTYVTRVRAEAAAGTVLGVRRISNHLIPEDAPSGTDDRSLTEAVVKYLGDFRQFGNTADLRVKTTGGIVTLTGRVGFFQARQLAAALTALVGGVKGVDNRITLDVALIAGHGTIVEAAQ